MARRRARRTRRSTRARITPAKVALGLALAAALGYFAFTRVFFDPFEEPVKTFDLLAPRDVDLFVHRQGLRHDISTFPRLREIDRLLQSSAWRTMAGTAWYAGLGWPAEAEALAQRVRDDLREAPLDPVADLFGEEVAVLGRAGGGGGGHALLARLSAKAKLAVDALHKVGGVLGRVVPGAVAEQRAHDGVPGARYVVVQQQGAEPLYYARVRDLLVAGDDEALVKDVLALAHSGSELSVGLSRDVLDHLPKPRGRPEDVFSVAFTADLAAGLAAWGLPPPSGERKADALANVLPRVVDPTLLQTGLGRLELENGRLHLRLHAGLHRARAVEDTGGLLGQPADPLPERLRDALGILPADVAAAVTLNVDLRRFLRTVIDGFDPELRRLLDQRLKGVQRANAGWPVDNVLGLVDQLASALAGRLTVAVRTLDHDVPPGSQPLPTLAFVLPLRDLDAWTRIEGAFINAASTFSIDREGMWQYDEGVGVRKWVEVPDAPMEEICWIVLDKETLVISTDQDFVVDLVQVYAGARASAATGATTRTLLAGFQEPGGRLVAQANAAAWIDAERLQRVLAPYAPWLGELETKTDLAVERARRKRELVAQEYPQHRGSENALPRAIETALEARLDALVMETEQQRLDTVVPAWAAAWAESWSWLGLLDEAAIALRWAQGTADLEVHLATVVAP